MQLIFWIEADLIPPKAQIIYMLSKITAFLSHHDSTAQFSMHFRIASSQNAAFLKPS
jgi:hypothetical protein